MALTPNGGPEYDEPAVFHNQRTTVADHSDVTRLLESKKPKAILRAAEGRRSSTKPKLKKFPGGAKNLAKEAKSKKKRGPFGNVSSPVSAPAKGKRVAES